MCMYIFNYAYTNTYKNMYKINIYISVIHYNKYSRLILKSVYTYAEKIHSNITRSDAYDSSGLSRRCIYIIIKIKKIYIYNIYIYIIELYLKIIKIFYKVIE